MLRGPFNLLSGLLCLLAVNISYGQKTFIKVLDQKTKEPLAFCHVCFEGLNTKTSKYNLTNIDGLVANDVKEKSKIAISCVGYVTYIDTILPGVAMEVLLRPTILNINEVVITGQYAPEKADKSIYKIEVLNARLIEQKAAVNIGDLLKDQAAMRVSQDGVLGTSLRIQGMSGENVKFLMDGVPMIGRLNGNFDLNQINLFNVDHIEVIKGPMSVIYGSNALAGAINIITKENKTSKLNTVVDGYYESVGQYNLNFSASTCLGKQGIAIEGGRNLFDGYSYHESSDRQMDYKPRRQYFIDGYYFYSDKGIKLKANANYLNELMLYKGALLPPYYETAFDDYYTTNRAMLYLSGSFDLKRSRFVNFLGSYSYYTRTKQTKYKDLTVPSEIDVTQDWGRDTTQMTTIGFRSTFARNKSDFIFNYQVGLDLNHETGSGQKILGDFQEIGDYAAFLSATVNPDKMLSIQPSVRFAYNTKYNAPVVWSLSGKWDIMTKLSLRLSFASGFRAPGIKELYLSFVDINHDITGNPDLKAEYSKYGNIDLTWSSEKGKKAMSSDLSIYFNYIDDKISLARVGNSMSYVYSNVSNYVSTGFSFDYSFALHPSLTVQTGFALTGISGTIDTKISMDDLVWTPDLSVSSTYRFVKHDITLALYYKFSGSTPQLVIDANELGYNIVEKYNTVDFTATKGFWNNRIRLSTGVKNILNVTTIPSTGAQGGAHSGSGDGNTDIGYGRTWFAKLTFQFNKYK